MKQTLSVILAIMLISPVTILAQEKDFVKKIKVSDVSIQTGGLYLKSQMGTLNDFKNLAPKSSILQNDLSGYNAYNDDISEGNGAFAVNLGIQFRNKQGSGYKANPQLRLGFIYFKSTPLSATYYHENRQPYDTLTSSQTGQTYYIDSVSMNYYSMYYSSQQFRLEGSLIFRTNPEARWSLYAGIGLSAGVSLNANTDIYHSQYSYPQMADVSGNYYGSPYYPYYNNENDYYTETFRNKMNFGMSLSVPLGVDFRMANKSEFWRRLHLFYEIKPMLDITSIPEIRTIVNSGLQSSFGLRVMVN